MGREDNRRPTHELSCKVKELREILDAANQLERFPDCEVKEALKAEIADYLNPSESVAKTRVIGSLSETFEDTKVRAPAETSSHSKESDDADWSPNQKKKFFSWPILVGILVVALLVFSALKQIFNG